MVDILVTNDDGYKHQGFISLVKELSKHFSVIAVVPDRERSWIGKSLTALGEIELKKEKIGDVDIFTCTGTPADCIQVGLHNILDKKPKLVVSGINKGPNIGHGRILSSGTIGAAMEASIGEVRSVAFSMWCPLEMPRPIDYEDPKLYEDATKIAAKVVKIMIDAEAGPHTDLVSVNILYGSTIDTEFEITRPFVDPYGKLKQKKGDKYVHIHPKWDLSNLKEGTDLKAMRDGKISITPLSLELVEKSSMEKLRKVIEKKW